MSKADWNQLLIFGTAAVLVAALVGVIRTRRRGQVALPFLITVVAAFAIYPAMVDGADSFHVAIVVCSLLAITVSAFLIVSQPWRSKLATISWAMLGVVTPYLLFIGLLTAACAGKSECLG